MKNIGFILSFLILFAVHSNAQELNANVQIISPRLTNENQGILQNLKANISNVLNATHWTNENWKPEEAISCTFVINISAWDGASAYTASAQILSKRPVFGSTYTSTLLNLNDKDFNFSYTDGQTFNFSIQNSGGDLPSLLGFYAYIILGLDRDSFTELGGNPFYTKAQSILNNAQMGSNDGWKASGSNRNRYWLLNNITDVNFKDFRKFIYAFHREGLDLMCDNFSKGQTNILKSLPLLNDDGMQRNQSIYLNSFFSAKAEEITNCLITANSNDKSTAFNILTKADPTNYNVYDALNSGNNQGFTSTIPQNQPSQQTNQQPSYQPSQQPNQQPSQQPDQQPSQQPSFERPLPPKF